MKENTDVIWLNIVRNENKIFKTIRGVSYTYIVKDNFILINGDKRRRITKDMINCALHITNPLPSKLKEKGIWGPSYVYGIITDDRIKI